MVKPWDGFCELSQQWVRLAQSTAHPQPPVHTLRCGGSAAPVSPLPVTGEAGVVFPPVGADLGVWGAAWGTTG